MTDVFLSEPTGNPRSWLWSRPDRVGGSIHGHSDGAQIAGTAISGGAGYELSRFAGCGAKQVQEKTNFDILFVRMPEGSGGAHGVVVAATNPFVGQVARFLQFGNDSLR